MCKDKYFIANQNHMEKKYSITYFLYLCSWQLKKLTMEATDVISMMQSLRNEHQRIQLMRFFKTGIGDYGEGDEFLGLTVPQTRLVVLQARDMPLRELPTLLTNKYHEVRLCGFLILVYKFERLSSKRLINDPKSIEDRDCIVSLYLKYSTYANNWDLVDLSAPKILGHWLLLPSHLGNKRSIVDSLAYSNNLWQQRISMVCTWKTTQQGDPSWCLRYAEIHLHHPHDLMHKALGWMLREMGKRVDMNLLRDFLRQNVCEMSRTSLRYAIERMSEDERHYWLSMH